MTDPPAYVFRLQMGVTDQHPGGFETANESNLWHRQPKLEERDIVEMLRETLPRQPEGKDALIRRISERHQRLRSCPAKTGAFIGNPHAR